MELAGIVHAKETRGELREKKIKKMGEGHENGRENSPVAQALPAIQMK